MPALKTTPLDRRPAPWLPNLDLHEQDGKLVIHADLMGFDAEDVEISLDGADLIVQAEGGSEQEVSLCYVRLPLPFAPQGLRTVSRPGHEGLEIHIPIPPEGLLQAKG